MIIILLITILTITILIQLLKEDKQKNVKLTQYDKKENEEKINYKDIYKPKRYITTINELNFYSILLEIVKELDMILFSQVSLYNIVETKYNNQAAFNKIRSKTIDFVIVDKNNCKIKLCIELDDETHKQANRIERDKFINELFKQLEINLIRFKVSNYYNKEALKKRIQESIIEHYYID